MKPSDSHFIWIIQDGEVKKVHNTDSHGRPDLRYKELKDIYQHENAECTPMPLSERNKRTRNTRIVQLDESDGEDLTLSQLKKESKRKKRKASESVLLTPKAEDDDDFDLSEPLFKLRLKVSKSSLSEEKHASRSFPTSELSKDLATVRVKIEADEMDDFECRETNYMADGPFVCNGSVRFDASETRCVSINPETESSESELLTNAGEICGFSEVSLNTLENMELDTTNVLLPLSVSELESMKDDSSLEDLTASTFDCSQSQQMPEQINYISSGQDSWVDFGQTSDEGPLINPVNGSSSLVPEILSLPWLHSWVRPDDHDDDVVPTEAKSPESEEKQYLTSDSMNSDHIVFVSEDVSVLEEQPPFVSEKADSEVKLDQTDIKSEISEIKDSCCLEARQPERLPLTRKAISPNSQKNLCQAMESAELVDDMDHYKCKEKLYFEEQAENKFSSSKADVEDTEPNVHPQQGPQFIQNKDGIGSKHVVGRAKIFKKGCLDGPRLCRSLPRLSTGSTSRQGCSESAIAFSQRQMHDIETLASKLMGELDSMKTFVEEKMLYEAYRSPSLKNEADEVKSAIKRATKTEEAAKKWLSMMTRDCNRFCKIMKLNEGNAISASDDPALGEKLLQREKKKISFADEAGGSLCDIKVYQINSDSVN